MAKLNGVNLCMNLNAHIIKNKRKSVIQKTVPVSWVVVNIAKYSAVHVHFVVVVPDKIPAIWRVFVPVVVRMIMCHSEYDNRGNI